MQQDKVGQTLSCAAITGRPYRDSGQLLPWSLLPKDQEKKDCDPHVNTSSDRWVILEKIFEPVIHLPHPPDTPTSWCVLTIRLCLFNFFSRSLKPSFPPTPTCQVENSTIHIFQNHHILLHRFRTPPSTWQVDGYGYTHILFSLSVSSQPKSVFILPWRDKVCIS